MQWPENHTYRCHVRGHLRKVSSVQQIKQNLFCQHQLLDWGLKNKSSQGLHVSTMCSSKAYPRTICIMQVIILQLGTLLCGHLLNTDFHIQKREFCLFWWKAFNSTNIHSLILKLTHLIVRHWLVWAADIKKIMSNVVNQKTPLKTEH